MIARTVLISLLSFTVFGWAADKPVKIRKHRFADDELEARSALDEKGRAALTAWIESANCEYTDINSHQKNNETAKPEIFAMQIPDCQPTSKTKSVAYCAGAAMCESRVSRFLVRDVFCEATSPTRCPPAKQCALATNLTRSIPNNYQSGDGKQEGYMEQDNRGWDRGNTNRYPWTEATDEELDKFREERKQNKMGKGEQ